LVFCPQHTQNLGFLSSVTRKIRPIIGETVDEKYNEAPCDAAVNLLTARELGIEVPSGLLSIADEVIG
jgi:hypothetical protein